MRRWAALAGTGVLAAPALLLAQCGTSSSSTESDDIALPDRVDPADAGTVDASPLPSPDASVPDAALPGCDRTKPFGAPVRLAEFDAASPRATPRLSADELTIYFTTRGSGNGTDLSSAKRPSRSAPFAGEVVLAQSSAANENDPSVSADDLSLWFHSVRNGSADIFTASRASSTAAFGAETSLTVVNQAMTNEVQPYFRVAGNELWFASDRPAVAGAAGYDIYVAPRVAAVFGAPKRVAELSSASQDQHPQISEDGKTIIFSSDRAGGKGKLDVWMATRADASGAFDKPVPLTELNSANVDQAGWLSADGCRVWFSSGRTSADTIQVLFSATRAQ
jgi:Tol biopolymer transport system component